MHWPRFSTVHLLLDQLSLLRGRALWAGTTSAAACLPLRALLCSFKFDHKGRFRTLGARASRMPLLIPEQCRAARGLLDWTQEELAERADVSRSTIRDFENGRHVLHPTTAAQVIAALERGGALLIPADEAGPGVRLQRPLS